MSPEIRSACGADERVGEGIRDSHASMHLGSWNLARDPAVARKQRTSKRRKRKKQLSVFPVQMKRCGPKLFLIECHVFQEGRNKAIFRILSGRQESRLVVTRG